jgi:hypothetical protein
MPRTIDLERPSKKHKRLKPLTNISVESRAHELARQQNYIGAASAEIFSASDTLYVNSVWSSIDDEDSWCVAEGYISGDKQDFLENLGYVRVDISIKDHSLSESYVEDTFDYEN